MMTLEKFKESMKKLVDRPNSLYSNEFPYNCCYYDGTFIYADCNNVIKSICWSDGKCADNYEVGKYYYSPNAVMGDWTGQQILDHCTEVSSDFSHIEDGEFVYMWNNGSWHCGVYYGNGTVFESTPLWEDGIQFSQIDIYGNRLYGGKSYGRWEKHGKLNFVEYPKAETATLPSQPITQTPTGQNIIIQNLQPSKELTETVEKPTIMDSIVNLLKIKSLVTLALTAVVVVRAINGDMNIEQIYLMVIAFYFGTQTVKGDNK